MPDAALTALKQVFGFDAFRPNQEPVVRALLTGQDVLAVMPTGAGKSLCYQVPALVMDGLTIVVSPLVALMEDQVAALDLAGVAAGTINSARDRAVNVETWQRVAAGEIRLLYLSPERLMTVRMIAALQRMQPVLFAVDEAHCISRWGAAFRPEYEMLGGLRDAFPAARLAAFTATADPATQQDIAAKLFQGEPATFVAGFDRPNITLSATPRTGWQGQLDTFLRDRPDDSGIVYCLSRKNVEEVAAYLSDRGFNALPYHAGMEAGIRTAHQDRFMTESPVIMVATIAFGMGIDKPDIRFVLHTHLPATIEAYYQEIGRAGRDGAPADALMLYGLDDIRMRRQFIDREATEADHKRREHKRLDALVAFAEASTCRRAMLLAYFGERCEPCGNCDICLNPPVMVDATKPAQMALSAIARTGQRFGAAHIIDVLRGSENQKIVQLGHDRLPTHGVGKDMAKGWWQAFLRQLVSAGHLEIDIQGFGGLRLTASGQQILKGVREFECRQMASEGATPARRRERPRPPDAPKLDADGETLLTRLKAHRMALARAANVPPYVIFHDRTLIAMADARPASRDEFLALPGVGEAKAEKFADSFLGPPGRLACMKIAIAGAGVAGLAAAALLARDGHDVTVFDQFPEPRPVGSGLMIQPVGLAVLADLGCADAVVDAASPIARILGRTVGGRTVLDVQYADLRRGLAGLAIQRSVLFDQLLAAAQSAGAILSPGIRITGAHADREAAWLDGDGARYGPFDLVLDCLGAYSPLCPKPSRPLRYGALWALLDWPDRSAFAIDRLEQRYRGAAKMVGILPVGRSPGGNLKLTFFWSLRGIDHAAWRAAPLGDWKTDVAALWPETAPVLDQVASHDDLVFARYTHHTVRNPGRGRIAHLGDSHHATSPQLGQGANTALLDAAALAAAVAGHPDPAIATKAYASARRRHVWLYQSASRLFTPMYQSDGHLLPWIRDRIGAPVAQVAPMPRILAKLVAGEMIRPVR